MALIPVNGVFFPSYANRGQCIPALLNAADFLIQATGQKAAYMGRVWNKDHASKNIQSVGFRFGTIVKAGGSGLTVSLQDVLLTAGTPAPDEVQDQTVAIANGNASFATGTWINTGNLSANRAVAYGELVAVVVEFDGGGRLGSDSVMFSNANPGQAITQAACTLKTAAWAQLRGNIPNVLLAFDDGTFGTLDGSFVFSGNGTFAFKQDTAVADEYCNEFSLPFSCKVDGAWVSIFSAANTADFNVILYSGTTALATTSVDANTLISGGTGLVTVPFPEITLSAGATYRLSVQPSQTASTVTVTYFDVNTASHFQVHELGTNCVMNTRVDLGAWGTPTATRRLCMGVRVSALDDGAGVLVGGYFPRLIFKTGWQV